MPPSIYKLYIYVYYFPYNIVVAVLTMPRARLNITSIILDIQQQHKTIMMFSDGVQELKQAMNKANPAWSSFTNTNIQCTLDYNILKYVSEIASFRFMDYGLKGWFPFETQAVCLFAEKALFYELSSTWFLVGFENCNYSIYNELAFLDGKDH